MNVFSLGPDHRLRIGEHHIQLTPIEARAWTYLSDRLGAVVPRESLERDVWGLHPGVKSEAVPVAIRVLRKKLGPHQDLLETIRSVGWRLHAPSSSFSPLVDATSVQRFRDELDTRIEELRTADEADIDALCVHLVRGARLIIPSESDRVLRAITLRAPNRLVARILTAPTTGDVAAIEAGRRHEDPWVRWLSVDATLQTDPSQLDPDWMEELEQALVGMPRLEVAGTRMLLRANHGDANAFDDLDALLDQARSNPVVHLHLLWRFGGALWRQGAVRRAAFLLHAAMEEGRRLGVNVLRMQRLHALCTVHEVPLDIGPLLEVSTALDAEQQPTEAALSRGYAAWMLAGAGRFDEMAPLLDRDVAPPTFQAVLEHLRWLMAARHGDPHARVRLETCAPERFTELGQDPLFSAFLATWLRHLVRAALGDHNAWADIRDLDGPEGVEVDTLRRLAGERAKTHR